MRITTSSLPFAVGIVATRSSSGLVLGELEPDLAVLGLAALGDVEVRHDLDAGDERVAVRGRDLLVDLAVAVEAEAHHGGGLLAVGLDVDVRAAALVGVGDDLVGELDDRRIALADRLLLLIAVRLHRVAAAVLGGELPDDLAHVLAQPVGGVDEAP